MPLVSCFCHSCPLGFWHTLKWGWGLGGHLFSLLKHSWAYLLFTAWKRGTESIFPLHPSVWAVCGRKGRIMCSLTGFIFMWCFYSTFTTYYCHRAFLYSFVFGKTLIQCWNFLERISFLFIAQSCEQMLAYPWYCLFTVFNVYNRKMDALYYNQYHNDIIIFKAFTEVQIPLADMTLAWLLPRPAVPVLPSSRIKNGS